MVGTTDEHNKHRWIKNRLPLFKGGWGDLFRFNCFLLSLEPAADGQNHQRKLDAK